MAIRTSFDRFPRLEYFDATPIRPAFSKRLWQDARHHWLPLLVGLAALTVGMWRYGTADGWSNLFNASAQVVSIFVAVFLVFAAVQRPAGESMLPMFTRGTLDEYHRSDLFLVQLAVLTVFTTLIGGFLAKYVGISEAITLLGYALPFEVTRFNMLLWLVGAALLVEFVVLFVSLPEYYFARARNLLYSELARMTLDKRFNEVHGAPAVEVRELPPGDEESGEHD